MNSALAILRYLYDKRVLCEFAIISSCEIAEREITFISDWFAIDGLYCFGEYIALKFEIGSAELENHFAASDDIIARAFALKSCDATFNIS